MVIMTSEKNIIKLAKAYRNMAAFAIESSMKGYTSPDEEDDFSITYEHLPFIPGNDDITAIKNGDIKLKTLVKRAIKEIRTPKGKEIDVSLGMVQLLTMLTANRKSKNGPSILAFVESEDEERNKIVRKFLNAILKEFGLTLQKWSVVKKAIKLSPSEKRTLRKETIRLAKRIRKRLGGKKAKRVKKAAKRAEKMMLKQKTKLIVGKVQKAEAKKKGATLNGKGLRAFNRLQLYFDIELRQTALDGLGISDINRKVAEKCIKALTESFTGRNLKNVNDKDMKFAKSLAKKDRKHTKSYNTLRKILIDVTSGDIKLPKAEYGSRRKGGKKRGKIIGNKMNVKKFKKFFMKSKNRELLLLIFAHLTCVDLGATVGSKDYLKEIGDVANRMTPGFGKEFISAVKAYVAAEKENEKEKK